MRVKENEQNRKRIHFTKLIRGLCQRWGHMKQWPPSLKKKIITQLHLQEVVLRKVGLSGITCTHPPGRASLIQQVPRSWLETSQSDHRARNLATSPRQSSQCL
uniref:Uncharacterized protein n=1 Tax=Micrurus paraensis TaxID=1970185 RepID=A0A2D4KU00_9SAUR